ncbi:MAG TPA: YHS domain-containing (seleno)protein, partial [Candidatus Polarisedimenticolia bacterium]|nr:YHS domain-containing (seleno)protein [Candidatus Polarisedimenticolia bacterium]
MRRHRATRHHNLGPDGLALEGHDPVGYVEQGRAVKGRPDLALPHAGAIYWFSSEARRERFAADPGRYLPAYGGWCATGMAAGRRLKVDPSHFLLSNGRLLLFYPGTREAWQREEGTMRLKADRWWSVLQAGSPGAAAVRAAWVLQLLAAVILFQTLFFKFTGAEESVYIFTTLGMEPWGRIGSGLAELVAVILLLIPRTAALGAMLSLGVISGALMSHLTRLGIEVQGDGGLLFGLAVVVFAACAGVAWLRRSEIPIAGPRLFGGPGPGPGGGGRGPGAGKDAPDAAGQAMACTLTPGDGRRRVLILGGGFGGVYTALELEKRRGLEDVEVTLVNRENFFLFTPMLHEVAASDLDPTNIVSPVRKMLRKVRFFEGDVERIDLDGKRVTLSHGSDRHAHEVAYDQLVIALGSITNFYDLPGLEERALTIKSLGDAMQLRNRLIARLEEADTECAAAVRAPLLTFVVAGGGFAGVETVASLNDFVREALPYYPSLSEDDLRVVLIHSGPLILPELGEELGAYARRKLEARGVEIRTGTRVAGLTEGGVLFSDGTSIPSRTLVWTAGTSPHPLLSSLPCAKDRGRIQVEETLEVPGYPGVWALGDCAMVPDRRTGKACPPTAQHALREGRTAAANIVSALEGGPRMPFVFATLGQLATIGRRTGVARVFGITFSGFTAWWLWRTIYLAKLPRLEKKVRVALDWTLDLFFSKDLVQFLTDRAPAVP